MFKTGLEDTVDNLSGFLAGRLMLLGNVKVNEDIVYVALIKPSEYDSDSGNI